MFQDIFFESFLKIYEELVKKKAKMEPQVGRKKQPSLSEKFTAILNDSSTSQADVKKLTD